MTGANTVISSTVANELDGASSAGRRALLANGYEPIPICGKGPRWHWRRGPITDHLLNHIENDPQFADHKNTGLRTGHLVGIDVDVRAPEHIEIVKSAVFAQLGKSYVQRVGSKGVLLCYYNPDPIPKLAIVGRLAGSEKEQVLVEILGEGQQVATYGIHPITGRPYQWLYAVDDDEPLYRKLTDLPQVTPDTLRNTARKIREALSAAGYLDVAIKGLGDRENTPTVRREEPVSLSWIKSALTIIPPSIPRQEWLSVIWAIKEASIIPDVDDADRIDFLDRWSSGELAGTTCESYRGYRDVANSYDWAKGTTDKPVTVGTMWAIAQQHGFLGGPPRVNLMELVNDNLVPEDNPELPAIGTDNRWTKLTRLGHAIVEMPPAGMIVPGWLRDRGFTGILAQRGTGKTVVAAGLGLSIASGKTWMGEPAANGYYVVYLCGEDQENTAAHIEAWCNKHNGGQVPSRFIFVEDVPDLLAAADCDKLVAHLKTIIPNCARAVIVADTWQRATCSAKDGQNSDRDMAAAATSLENIAKAFGGTAIACFHPPKGEKGHEAPSVHGSAVIENTSTGIWTLVADNAGLKLEVTRIKGPGLKNFKRVRLESVLLGRSDAFGCELTGKVAVWEGGIVSGLTDRAEREKFERRCVLEAALFLIDKGIGLVRTHGKGQKPADIAKLVKERNTLTLSKREAEEHLNALERDGLLEYVYADKNSRAKAGFRRPTRTPAETAAEIVPNTIPSSAEDF